MKEKSKVITIRGTDKELFERFSSLTKTWGKNTGTIFTTILHNYLEENSSSLYLPAVENRLKKLNCKHLEVIENKEELVIAKNDLTSLPEDVKFYFINIKKLVISEDIDTETLLRYIYSIKNSGVCLSNNIEKIPFLSLLHSLPRYQFSNRKIKDVTIRNVQEQTWNDFKAHCQLYNAKIGVLVSEILWDIIPEMEITQILLSKIKEPLENIFVISTLDSVEINHSNIKAIAAKKILFHRINELTFREDISNIDLLENIVGIYNCQKIIFPKSVSKLLKLSKVHTYPDFNQIG